MFCPDEDVSLQMALFAGRRSSDRIFLLLQNLLCARHLPNYMGTSSVFAITLINRAAQCVGMSCSEQRRALTGALAHLGKEQSHQRRTRSHNAWRGVFFRILEKFIESSSFAKSAFCPNGVCGASHTGQA